MALKGNKYGTHRVIEPKGVLTQAAYRIDNNMDVLYSNEIICDVQSLNIDSASFTQIEEACGGDEQKIGEMILSIVAERGKQQNPVTGSGGMFIGTVAYIGEDLKDRDLKVGDKIWWDINQTDTLNVAAARDGRDERHICPLQLPVIERIVELYTNPNDIVFTPFMGIASEVYQSVKMGRRGVGIELKESYFRCACENMEMLTNEKAQMSLFDFM